MTLSYDWAGPVRDAWAVEWRRTDLSFAGLSPHLDQAILAAAPETGTAVDIGCGAGGTSLALAAARPLLSVLGIDLSESLIETARSRASPYPNLSFRAGDATGVADLGGDLFFSRHVVMFFDEPKAAVTRLRAAASFFAKVASSAAASSSFSTIRSRCWRLKHAMPMDGGSARFSRSRTIFTT